MANMDDEDGAVNGEIAELERLEKKQKGNVISLGEAAARRKLKKEAAAAAVASVLEEMLDQEPEDPREVFGASFPQLMCDAGTNTRGPKLLLNGYNAQTILNQHPETVGMLGFDEFQQQIVLFHPAPDPVVRGRPEKFKTPRPLRDSDCIAVQYWLQRGRLTHIKPAEVIDAMTHVARLNSFHPVKRYLESLKWDGVERIAKFGPEFLGTKDTEYEAAIFTSFFVSAVARIFDPGCKVDTMVIVEGKQGWAKSTMWEILAGEWFSDALPDDINSKDTSQHLNGKWIIELAEMHAMKQTDIKAMKKFLTRRIEKYRPAYGRCEVNLPRQCVFVGTTNEGQYFRDTTGNRRFFPTTATKQCAREALVAVRDQLWAEAVILLKAGTRWWFTPEFEAEWCVPEQEARMEVDALEQALEERFAENGKYQASLTDDGVTDVKGLVELVPYVDVYTHLGLPKNPQRFQTGIVRRVFERHGWVSISTGSRRMWMSPRAMAAKETARAKLEGLVEAQKEVVGEMD